MKALNIIILTCFFSLSALSTEVAEIKKRTDPPLAKALIGVDAYLDIVADDLIKKLEEDGSSTNEMDAHTLIKKLLILKAEP